MQPAKLWQSEHWHRKEFWRGKSLGLLCPWPTTAAPMSESLLSRCQSFEATKPFDCALVWALCTIHTWGKSIPLKPGCALPCLPARERPAHPYSPLSWPSARPPPCPPPVLLHNSAQCSQCISKNFESVCNAVLVFNCVAWLVVGVRREQRGLPQ